MVGNHFSTAKEVTPSVDKQKADDTYSPNDTKPKGHVVAALKENGSPVWGEPLHVVWSLFAFNDDHPMRHAL